MSKSKKEKLTEIILDHLPNSSTFKTLSPDKTLMRWWVTGRSSNNLRLTDEGKQAFDLAEIEFYDYPLFTEQELKDIKQSKKTIFEGSQFTVKLKKIDCPFYVGMKTNQTKSAYIRVYDSKVAMMITLYGSFTEYLEAKK
jgi:hypothetical protein